MVPKIPLAPSDAEEQSLTEVPPECIEELQVSDRRAVHSLLADGAAKCGIKDLIDIHRFSSFNRLLNTLTHVLKFCSILRRRSGPTAFDGNERKFAEILLIRDAQVSLKAHKNFTLWEKQLSLFADESGILRCKGRIENALDLPYSTKHPVILPGDHPITVLYVYQGTSQWH